MSKFSYRTKFERKPKAASDDVLKIATFIDFTWLYGNNHTNAANLTFGNGRKHILHVILYRSIVKLSTVAIWHGNYQFIVSISSPNEV